MNLQQECRLYKSSRSGCYTRKSYCYLEELWEAGEMGQEEPCEDHPREMQSPDGWRGITPGTSTGWGPSSWEAALLKGPGDPGGHEADHEPAVCPCSEGSQQQLDMCSQQAEEGCPSLLSPGETHLGCCVQFPSKRKYFTGASPAMGYKAG